jgi:hypothetical protein
MAAILAVTNEDRLVEIGRWDDVNISCQNASDPTTIQRARAAAGYESGSTGTSSIGTGVQHTGLASSEAARNNVADDMEEASRLKEKWKMGSKSTCIRELHDAAVPKGFSLSGLVSPALLIFF